MVHISSLGRCMCAVNSVVIQYYALEHSTDIHQDRFRFIFARRHFFVQLTYYCWGCAFARTEKKMSTGIYGCHKNWKLALAWKMQAEAADYRLQSLIVRASTACTL